ncbi:hypothetical protein [Pedobacter foliorum]|uniref:hypothetical protein n=1 Tax=Pedobacter foliorum TaxID=2739058 RepID=UPI0015663035|nr:hypothetical protein [Pedobacter foliorum]NRF38417.1 hypothetical protein [Pedobacter foliorum]
MKRGFFTALATILFLQLGNAQTIKTGVLIIGDGSNAVGASIQSSVSGAKTVLLLPGQDFEATLPSGNLSSGVEADLIKRLKVSDQSKEVQEKAFGDKAKVSLAIKSWTDTLKNLTIIKNASWLKLKRSGSGWSVQLSDGRTVKATALINADRSGKVNEAIMVQNVNKPWHALTYDNNLYRTSIAAGQQVQNVSSNLLFVSDLLIPNQENLVVLNPQTESVITGQAAGALAAYAAFFKTKISQAPLKEIQGELIRYQLSPMPFADIKPTDSNWKSIQFLGLSGFLKADIVNGVANFKPEQLVSTAEIKEPIKEYYYKAQIWFDDNKETQMTLGSTLSLVCYVGGKSPKNTEDEIKKNWSKVYKVKTEYDPKRNITRREFAVLVNDYLKPFGVNIDKSGRVLR